MEDIRDSLVMLRVINGVKPKPAAEQGDADIINAMAHLREFKGD